MDLKGFPLDLEEFERFQMADGRVFRKIFDCYKPSLQEKVCRLTSSPTEAEEIVQEVFVQLFLKRKEIPSAEAIFPFLYVVAKRLAISHFRKEVIRKQYRMDSGNIQLNTTSCAHIQLEQKEREQMLEKIIDALPAQQKRIYQMNKFEEKSYQEIAEHIGISRNTVRNHLTAACSFVKLRLQKILFTLAVLLVLC
ncbi:sigma-70 family RNA polymerase sigma factor [Sphingobacterium puteale]|uniref:Sigma-70 family RNA polymerase sigma factor n=1 Tax=Sphingobacterium puteale TaxID=2420510 RepID=A0A420VT13_9SPHI|nr:sigma-70 family RNA polymerase sigma factor [Sphingobacterium puteale]RKO69454.1 sigma-70 family RNA polymerase sigma factor [Sphingobacterium puteale]